MEEVGIPDFSKAYSPRKQFKLTRAMYQELLKRVEVLEGKEPKKEPEKEPEPPKRKRRTKEEMEADNAETK